LFSAPSTTPRLQRREHLVIAHRHAVAAERVHHVHEHRIAHDAELLTLQIFDRTDRLLDVVHAAGAGIHPAQADEPDLRIGRDLVEQFMTDVAVDHLLHMIGVPEQERQVEDVEIGNHRPERADADAGQLDRAQLSLFDRLLLAAQLHGREHLDGEPAAGRLLELLAHADHDFDRGIAERMHVRRLQHHGIGGQGAADRRAAGHPEHRYREAAPKRFTSSHHHHPPFD
jgi:hypothetical protein